MADKGSQTRQRIIRKALALFCVKGFYNTSIQDVLAATGLTKGGLYGHFASKEALWYAVYDHALRIWREVVFEGIAATSDPLERIRALVENDIQKKLGNDVFAGGCFFHSMLTETAGQSDDMRRHVMQGFDQLHGLLCAWLQQAHQRGMLKDDLNFDAVARHIIIALNGTAALYAGSRDPAVLDQARDGLHFYIRQLEK